MQYRCTLHHTTAQVDPATRQVTLRAAPVAVGTAHSGQCALSTVAYRALDDAAAPVGVQGPPDPTQGFAPCEVIRDG